MARKDPNLERMLDFISSKGGIVRFDEYMQEHILGENGFYSSVVEIGENGHFETKSLKPGFANLIFLWLKDQGVINQDFIEIGGGNGVFKKNYMGRASNTNYISIDASPKLVGLQNGVNGKSILGDAAALPLKDGVEGVVFSNELMDELPCRVFYIHNYHGPPEVVSEGFVGIKKGKLKFRLEEVERDLFVETYEQFLKEDRPDIQNGSIVSVSPLNGQVISDMLRVLNKGKVVIIDYGYFNGSNLNLERNQKEYPYYRDDGGYISVNKILRYPYQVDLTHRVDFDFLRWIAEKQGASDVRLDYQHKVFNRLVFKYSLASKIYEKLLLDSNFIFMQIDVNKGNEKQNF